MTSSSEQPPYEMKDAYILTKEDWLKLREHLTIGCTNQKAFLDTLRPHPSPVGCPYWDPDKNYDNDDPENHCSCKFSTIKAEAARKAREEAFDEAIKIVLAYERKPKYDFEATLCSVIVESLNAAKEEKTNG